MRSSRFDAFDSTWIRQTTIGLVALIAGLGATGASAVDGVLEISQACVSVGCFPGDVPGFPVTIGADATSYRLTSDLDTSPNTDVTAVVVTAPNTSLDLNGFSILGPATCTGAGSTLSCSGGTGVGISAINDEGFNIENGGVRGHPARGIVTGARARVQNVSVEASGTGIEVGDQSITIRPRG